MRKVLFVSKSMTVGGVEKSLVSLLNSLDSKEYEIDLLLLEKKGDFLKQIPAWVNVMTLKDYNDIKREVNEPPLKIIKFKIKKGYIIEAIFFGIAYIVSKITDNYKYYYFVAFRHINKFEKKYDIAIAYSSIINYITWYVIFFVNAEKKIGWIHFDISQLRINKKLFLYLHNKLDKIYVVSKQADDIVCSRFPSLKNKLEVKYNLIDKENIIRLSNENINLKKDSLLTIVTLGRIEEEKGQDIIPLVAKILKEKGIKFKWYIIGDGNLKSRIEREVEKYELREKVIFTGVIINPYPYLKIADIYIQTSIHEGFCITLAEAKIFKPFIISTDFTGAREQLKDYKNSQIVNRNYKEIVKAICNFREEE